MFVAHGNVFMFRLEMNTQNSLPISVPKKHQHYFSPTVAEQSVIIHYATIIFPSVWPNATSICQTSAVEIPAQT